MKNKYKKIKNLIKQFGVSFSIRYIYYKVFNKDNKYIEQVYNYLFDLVKPIIENYNSLNQENIKKVEKRNKVPVWICWWQGYEDMPELCKMCYNRLKKMLPTNTELNLITLDNYQEYTNIPQFLVDKFEKGFISMTTFSDILRNRLIRDNGGLWIDSSIFVSKKINKNFFELDQWWSVNLFDNNKAITNIGQKISKRKWSSFLQKGEKNNLLNSFVCDAFSLYYENHDIAIDYFMQNLFIKIAYDSIPKIHEMIENIPINNTNVYSLYDNIDNEFNEKEYNNWNKNTTFYKLTQKRQYNKFTSENKLTYFGAIKQICEKDEVIKYEKK